MQVPINQAVLTDGEVRAALVKSTQAIIAQTQAITAQATREDAPRENPDANSTASRLRDFTWMNPPVYFGSWTYEDPKEFVDEVYKILCSMGVNEEEKAELATYQLKHVG